MLTDKMCNDAANEFVKALLSMNEKGYKKKRGLVVDE